MKILISAAETSSDAHGAELLKALRNQVPAGDSIEAFGIGGPKLQAAGFNAIVDAKDLLAMGFIEILGHLPRIFRSLNQVTEAAERMRPDVAVVIDYPDFHFRLARRLKKIGIPVIYYIPPKVWVWRKSRVELLRKLFVRVLSILPFEEAFYQGLKIPVKYVGNPLVDELPLSLSHGAARDHLSLKKNDKVILLMPGSRASELRAHLELMLKAVLLAGKKLRSSGFLAPEETLKVLIPFPLTANLEGLREQVNRTADSGFSGILDVRVSQGNAAECMVAADAGLVKSGTSTLEAGLLKIPHVVVYKPTRTTEWIFKYLIRYSGPVGLVNLVAGWKPGQEYLVPEILCEKVTVHSLCDEVVALLTNRGKRQRMIQGFETLREQVCGQSERLSPSICAAREVIDVVQSSRKG